MHKRIEVTDESVGIMNVSGRESESIWSLWVYGSDK